MVSFVAGCVFMIITGAFGLTVIRFEVKEAVCVYLTCSVILALYFLWALAYGTVASTALGPELTRQQQVFCGGTRHGIYYIIMVCNYGAHPYMDAIVGSSRADSSAV